MRLKRLLLCLAVEASENSTSDEIQGTYQLEFGKVLLLAVVGRGFGIVDDQVHTNHATYNLQTCLEMVKISFSS
jgi:hypothetical protein